MKKTISVFIMAFLVLSVFSMVSAIPGVAAHTESDPQVVPLLAGQTNQVGEVLVWNDDTNLYVKYDITSPGWYMTEVHLAVATSLSGIPQSKGNPVPGLFRYNITFSTYETEYTFTIPITWATGTPLFIAAHAKVCEIKTLTFESGVGTPILVYGPSSTYLPLNDPLWGSSAASVLTWKHGSWPLITGSNAKWISTDYYITDNGRSARTNSWRLFSLTFNVPGKPIDGSIVTADSDNAEEVYFNGALIGSDGTVTTPFDASGGDPHEWSTINDYALTPVAGSNTLSFIVHNYAYPTDNPQVNPTGLIYKVTVDYVARCDTAWAAGTAFPGKNWATYFTYTVQGWQLIQTLTVPALNVPVITSMDLVTGRDYKVEVSGTAWANTQIEFDAKYSWNYGDGGAPSTTWTDVVLHYESPWGPSLLDLFVNGYNVDWGPYQSTHVYSLILQGTGTPATFQFQINDFYPSNDYGFLTVKIYEWS